MLPPSMTRAATTTPKLGLHTKSAVDTSIRIAPIIRVIFRPNVSKKKAAIKPPKSCPSEYTGPIHWFRLLRSVRSLHTSVRRVAHSGMMVSKPRCCIHAGIWMIDAMTVASYDLRGQRTACSRVTAHHPSPLRLSARSKQYRYTLHRSQCLRLSKNAISSPPSSCRLVSARCCAREARTGFVVKRYSHQGYAPPSEI